MRPLPTTERTCFSKSLRSGSMEKLDFRRQLCLMQKASFCGKFEKSCPYIYIERDLPILASWRQLEAVIRQGRITHLRWIFNSQWSLTDRMHGGTNVPTVLQARKKGCLPHTRTQQRIYNHGWSVIITYHHYSVISVIFPCCWASSLSLNLQSCFLHIQTTARRFAVHQPARPVWGKMGGALCSNPKTLSSVSWPLNLRWISPCYGCWCPLIVHSPHPWQNQPAACWWWVQTFSKLPTGAPKWMPTKICIDDLVVLSMCI